MSKTDFVMVNRCFLSQVNRILVLILNINNGQKTNNNNEYQQHRVFTHNKEKDILNIYICDFCE